MLSSDASDEFFQLRTELAVARDLAAKAQANALNAEAEAARVRAINADLLARNAHLELMNEKMRRARRSTDNARAIRASLLHRHESWIRKPQRRESLMIQPREKPL